MKNILIASLLCLCGAIKIATSSVDGDVFYNFVCSYFTLTKLVSSTIRRSSVDKWKHPTQIAHGVSSLWRAYIASFWCVIATNLLPSQ